MQGVTLDSSMNNETQSIFKEDDIMENMEHKLQAQRRKSSYKKKEKVSV
jgi:hypothetical protein